MSAPSHSRVGGNPLPKGWAISSIADISIKCEQRKPGSEEEFIYVDIGSIDRDIKKISNPQSLKGIDAPSRARKIINKGDVIVSLTRPNLNAVALISEEFNGQIASTGFEVIKPISVDSRYVFALTRSKDFVDSISGVVQGALYPAAKSTDVQKYRFPLPPLAEQKDIADKLDHLLAQVESTKARLDRIPNILKRFRQSVLAAAVREKLTNLDSQHENKAIGEVCIAAFDGPFGSKLKTADYTKHGIRVVRLENIGHLFFDDEKRTYIGREKYESLKKNTLHINDILFSSFVDEEVRTCMFEKNQEIYINKADCFCLRPDTEQVDPKYLTYTLASLTSYYQIKQQVQGITRPRINLKILKSLKFAFPKVTEQTEIVRRVEQLFAHADKVEQQVQQAQERVNKLTQSILAKAFRGELTEQWRQDNPALISGENSAEALLAKIKAEREAVKPKKNSKRIKVSA